MSSSSLLISLLLLLLLTRRHASMMSRISATYGRRESSAQFFHSHASCRRRRRRRRRSTKVQEPRINTGLLCHSPNHLVSSSSSSVEAYQGKTTRSGGFHDAKRNSMCMAASLPKELCNFLNQRDTPPRSGDGQSFSAAKTFRKISTYNHGIGSSSGGGKRGGAGKRISTTRHLSRR